MGHFIYLKWNTDRAPESGTMAAFEILAWVKTEEDSSPPYKPKYIIYQAHPTDIVDHTV